MTSSESPLASLLLLELIRNTFANFLGSLTTIGKVLARSGGALGKGLSGGLTFAVRQIANRRARPDSEILGALDNSHSNLPATFGDFLSRCEFLIRGMQ